MILLRILFVLAASVFAFVVNAAPAGESKEKPRAEKAQQTQAQIEREAEEMLAAIVRVKTKAIPDARSNPTLGESREGTGVVIDERGYIVTIGYIVIEAESI